MQRPLKTIAGEPAMRFAVTILIGSLICWSILLSGSVSGFARAGDLRLVVAMKSRDTVAVRALLKAHADVNASQADGATALHWAVHWDDLSMVELLIRSGAHVNVTNDYGAAPLYLACL